jgi:metal-responsive CopG/Arc/MetJ family transcriptional regulator
METTTRKIKINITIDTDLLRRIDNYTNDTYLNRSSFIGIACNQYLDSIEVTQAIKDMAISMRKIADTGCIDKETLEKLQDYERLCKIFTNN